MRVGDGLNRFTVTAKAFHWATFLLLLASFGIGLTMVDMPLGPRKLEAYSWHKWVGVTVFVVTLLRLGWRGIHPAPPFPDAMPRWQIVGARLSHAGLYSLLLIMPVSGWLMSSALGIQTVYFGIVPLPDLVSPDRALGDSLIHLHHLLALTLAILIGVHAGAAVYHHFVLKDDIARRMIPFMTPESGDRS
jgi:cytochrome b561